MQGDSLNLEKTVEDLVMNDEVARKRELAERIFDAAQDAGIYPASIYEFYRARGKGEFSGFTVPAINLRSMTYDLACAIFRTAKRINSNAFVFEIARSEIGYTHQSPIEYAGVVLAAAIKESFSGPIFIQGDHFQVNAAKFEENPEEEIKRLEVLIKEAIHSGFYNIDIDSSTLVDVSQPDLKDQQRLNYQICARLSQLIRHVEPEGIVISVGGEIGEIGHQNSTPEDLQAFMTGLEEKLGDDFVGISKISVQTGTTHGGVILPNGSIAQIKVDFDTLRKLSEIARREYGLAGAVQHGASTLPLEAFHKFVDCETAEVHLATEFQNMIYDSEHFPADLKNRIYEWLKMNATGEAKQGETQEQFLYKNRKRALGPFKREIMALPQETREAIAAEVEKRFEFLFRELNIGNKKELVERYIHIPA
jgi:fructose/tagatose bisphosphate aldolase